MTRDPHAIAPNFAPEPAAAARKLARAETRASEPLRPERHEDAVRGAGHGIFVDACGSRKKARDEVHSAARRGRDHVSAEFAQSAEVRAQARDGIGIVE